LIRECGIRNPSRDDIEKALLYGECGGECPFTGRRFTLRQLLEGVEIGIRHIIPLARFPDDSHQNKILCWHEENSSFEFDRTPFEAYGSDSARWEAIESRIRAWAPRNRGKARRLTLRGGNELEQFIERQMNDSRYATALACRLLESLYGGRAVQTESGNRQVIFASNGAVTPTLRRGWGLQSILRGSAHSAKSQNQVDPRRDHRYHVIDAITVALTGHVAVQPTTLGLPVPLKPDEADTLRRIAPPWLDFIESVRRHLDQLVVSHRPEHKLSGPLHGETNLGRPYIYEGKTVVNIRKPVVALSREDIERIVDPAVRLAVLSKYRELEENLLRCEWNQDWPLLATRAGNPIPIKRVRIRKTVDPIRIGSGPRQRFAASSRNHHAVVFARLDENGQEARWESFAVSLFEATERKRRNLPVIQRRHLEREELRFKFSLMNGDTVEISSDGATRIFQVRSIHSSGVFSLVPIRDARAARDIAAAGARWRPTADALRKLGCRKVAVDALGRVHVAHD
jgi:CRISPR-associated endonuclease Csn1